MSCYHPIYATKQGKTLNGKNNLKIWTQAAVAAWEIREGKEFENRLDFVQLPCGNCVGCRLDYSKQWAARCMLELQYHDSAYFVTLTYNDDHLPIRFNENTGEYFGSGSLCKRDFQLFMKRLRRAFPDQKLRYFASGEYGENYKRPHYHAIIFGLDLDDLVLYKFDGKYKYFTSEKLNKVWSDNRGEPIGFAIVAAVDWNTCAYVARYVVKKLNGGLSEFYKKNGIEPEFSLMSRKPGIGSQYFLDHPELMENETLFLSTMTKGISFSVPRYFDRLYESIDPVAAALRKERKEQFSNWRLKNSMLVSNLNYQKQLAVDEENFEANNKKRLARKENFNA